MPRPTASRVDVTNAGYPRSMSRSSAFAVAALIVGCCAASCMANDETSEPAGPGGAGGQPAGPGGSGAGGDGLACPNLATCFPSPGDAWKGPVLLSLPSDGPGLVNCVAASVSSFIVFTDLAIARQAVCGCTCNPPAAADVCGGDVSFALHGDATCSDATPDATLVPASACVNVAAGPVAEHATFTPPGPAGAACSVGPTTTILPPLDRIRVCEFPASACDEGLCIPPTTQVFNRRCVYRDGDEVCPSGPLSERLLVYRDFVDQRGCSTCTCSDLNDAACGGEIDVYTTSCDDVPAHTIAPGACVETGPPAFLVAYQPAVTGTCELGGGEPIGGVQGSQPVTMCCEP